MSRTSAHTLIQTIKALALIGFFNFGAFAQQPAQPKPATAPAANPAKAAATPSAKKPTTPTATAEAKSAAPPVQTTQSSSEKVVLRVGEKEVTQSDLDSLLAKLNPQVQQTIARQGKRPFGEQYAMMLILSSQAVDHHLDSSPEVQRQLALQRMQMLAQAEYDALTKQAKLSPEETNKYFTEHPTEFEEVKVRQVVLRKKADGAAADAPGLSIPDARARADEIRKSLIAGTDANKVVKDFSVPNVIVIDAEPRNVRRGQLLPELDKAVFQLKDGEISDLVETPQVFVMAQAISRRNLELKDASKEIENKLLQQKLEAALADLRQKNPIWMDDAYFAAPGAPAAPVAPPANQAPGSNSPPQK